MNELGDLCYGCVFGGHDDANRGAELRAPLQQPDEPDQPVVVSLWMASRAGVLVADRWPGGLPRRARSGEGRDRRRLREQRTSHRLPADAGDPQRDASPGSHRVERRIDLVAQPLLLLRPLSRHGHLGGVDVHPPLRALRPGPASVVRNHLLGAGHPCRLSLSAAPMVPRHGFRRHPAGTRTEDLRR